MIPQTQDSRTLSSSILSQVLTFLLQEDISVHTSFPRVLGGEESNWLPFSRAETLPTPGWGSGPLCPILAPGVAPHRHRGRRTWFCHSWLTCNHGTLWEAVPRACLHSLFGLLMLLPKSFPLCSHPPGLPGPLLPPYKGIHGAGGGAKHSVQGQGPTRTVHASPHSAPLILKAPRNLCLIKSGCMAFTHWPL